MRLWRSLQLRPNRAITAQSCCSLNNNTRACCFASARQYELVLLLLWSLLVRQSWCGLRPPKWPRSPALCMGLGHRPRLSTNRMIPKMLRCSFSDYTRAWPDTGFTDARAISNDRI